MDVGEQDIDYGDCLGLDEAGLESLQEARHAALQPMYLEYQKGRNVTPGLRTFPALELLPTGDLDVNGVYDAATGEIVSVNAHPRSDPRRINFMGYHQEERCFVFKGQSRLFDEFMVFITALIQSGGEVTTVFDCPIVTRFPPDGLPEGLGYNEFASHVEIVQYCVFTKNASKDNESDNVDTSETAVFPNLDGETCDDLEAVVESLSEHDGAGSHDSQGTAQFESEIHMAISVEEDASNEETEEDPTGLGTPKSDEQRIGEEAETPRDEPAPTEDYIATTPVEDPIAASPGQNQAPTTPPKDNTVETPKKSDPGTVDETPSNIENREGIEIVRYDPALVGGRYPRRNRASTAPAPPPAPVETKSKSKQPKKAKKATGKTAKQKKGK
ncbi:hypothetical protein B0I35DRAFT_474605 [Stachybotrys elegans]|uniref:Uncharacterized protein n=1 Tax=Stachybotrys elegans TaxID=80388 RepID=A0A8K0SZU9_9HYPO|nr:hypothetical protein B0I35DRAFT_474605 [Stachybotrys elegans]